MPLLTMIASWVVALGVLVFAVVQLAPAGSDPSAWLLAVAGVAALAVAARLWAVRRSEQRRLRGRLHELAMVRRLRPLVG